ncbi:hypothetical protein [Sphingomonas sp. dw_22]|uniref:hypothetical protein n=1 Tax=Sphingomonas sp. dw_22 TaxID=2721175 RepID=UPI001BD266DD|nr:hypothetical protein [Sphingomonas sp. dw_22]
MAKPPDAKHDVTMLSFIETTGSEELGSDIFPFKRRNKNFWHSPASSANLFGIGGLGGDSPS